MEFLIILNQREIDQQIQSSYETSKLGFKGIYLTKERVWKLRWQQILTVVWQDCECECSVSGINVFELNQ